MFLAQMSKITMTNSYHYVDFILCKPFHGLQRIEFNLMQINQN